METTPDVQCRVIIGVTVNDREVYLVWTSTGNLGLLTKYSETEKFLFAIDQELEDSATSQAPDLVLGAMAMMALCQPPSPLTLSACFDIANIMVYWDTERERLALLTQRVGPDTAALIIETGWPAANDFIARVISATDRAKFNEACLLYFSKFEHTQRQ